MAASAGTRPGRAPSLAKYEVLEELGHGGMATVYRAHDPRLVRDVAIKILHPHLRDNREIAHRFSGEAKAVAKLKHPNIVEVYDVSSEEEAERYLVVELIRGPTLRKLLEERAPLPPEIAAAIVLEVLSGLVHAHGAGIVHRDVKPENVLVEFVASASERSGSAPVLNAAVKLTDFGIAKMLDAQGVTSTGQVLGSPAHMAPEQIEGREVDGRADVFGVGVLFYEAVVGHLPFRGNNPAQVLRRVLEGLYESAEHERPVIGREWSAILDRALARECADRYSDAVSMREAIEAELTRLSITAPRKELEAWLKEPDAWAARHEARLVDTLCKLGADAREASDPVAAAAAYNRALAYRPGDALLLKQVGRLKRSEARTRLARRVVPLVLVSFTLSTSAYGLARWWRVSRGVNGTLVGKGEPPASRPSLSPVESPPPVRAASSLAEPRESIVSPVGSMDAKRATILPTPLKSARPPVQRRVSFRTLSPSFGVLLAIDGLGASEPDPTRPFSLDDRPHSLRFSCRNELCVQKTIEIAPGADDVELDVVLSVVSAKLIVDGEPTHSYGVTEIPSLTVSIGIPTDIPMNSGSRELHVFDRTDPSSKPQLVKVLAGKTSTVSFKGR
jgi:tRNA A-37 threonylcarbamoyl transferase component Bud32